MSKATKYMKLTHELLNKHAPEHQIEVRITNGKRYLGQVTSRRNGWTGESTPFRLSLTSDLVNHYPHETVVDVILHEIAHVIAGHAAGHGPKWKQVCQKIGANPQRLYEGENYTPTNYKYTAYCPKCETGAGGFYRRPTRTYIHTKCRGILEITQQY